MAKVLVSEKYLHDIANAIRVKLDSQATYTPAQMAAAIADITGSISGTITPSTATSKALVTDSTLTAIANAIRTKLDVATLYTPEQMANAILSIEAAAPVVEVASWSSGTDEQVAALIDAAHAGTVDLQQDAGWAVGDVRTISISAFTDGNGGNHAAQDIDIVITSFDEYMECGNVLQFDFKDALAAGRPIHSRNNAPLYKDSLLYTTIPPLADALPSWISSRLIEFSIISIYDSNNELLLTGNKIQLRSDTELTGRTDITEGVQIPYYAIQENRIKKRGHNGSPNTWATRTRYRYNTNQWIIVNSDGSRGAVRSDSSVGIAPFGCL